MRRNASAPARVPAQAVYEDDRPNANKPGSRLFAVGDIIRGRYRVDRVLSGTLSTDIYSVSDLEASRSEADRSLALKTVSRDRLGSDITIARFERELKLSKRISHANILAIEDAFEVELEGLVTPVPCLLMERIEGEDLATRLARIERLGDEEARRIARQFAEALSVAHRAGVVHRDLKPESVMLTTRANGDTRVVLIDFGVARPTHPEIRPSTGDDLTATNVILGTPYYMAPELLDLDENRATDATPASDIYSFGLILFEMLTGRPAFLGRTKIQSIFMRLDADPPSPRVYAPELDPVWERITRRCLERSPTARFGDAAEIVALLDPDAPGAVEAETTRGDRGTSTSSADSRSGFRRWPTWCWVSMALIAVVLTWIAYAWMTEF